MKRLIVHIPKEGVPAYTPQEEEDSRACRIARRGILILLLGIYVIALLGWSFGFWRLGKLEAVAIAFMLSLSPIFLDQLVRPGKRKTWLWTLLIAPVFAVVPWCTLY